MSQLQENLAAVQAAVRAAEIASGRPADSVKLLVVSKTMPLNLLQELYALGVREFGENREPELEQKAAAMPEDVIWHFIGPVQSNKIRKVVKRAGIIHSVDSVEKLLKFDRIAGEEGKTPEVFLEVNVSGELSKGGMTPELVVDAVKAAADCRFVKCCGLMTMAPLAAETEELRQIFGTLRDLRDRAEIECGCSLPQLSMGMSGDFPEAIACGATVVRVGSKIFAGVPK